MDPLSNVLSLLKPRNYMSAGFDAGGDWAVRFPDQRGTIKTGAVVFGWCWLAVDGVAEPVRLEAGDSFLLPRGRPFSFASDMTVPPVEAARIFPSAREGGIVSHNGGGDCFVISSRFALTGDHADILLGALPPIVHIPAAAEDQAIMRLSVERMMKELRERQLGGSLVIQHLAHVMLVEALRLHLAKGPDGTGWLFALSDKRVGAAIRAMHDDPSQRWTLQALASHAGMSRSVFALAFRDKVGETPMTYLTRWRMLVAADRLAHSPDPVSAIALSLGYESESAFSTAFKRVMGHAPRQYASGRAAPAG